MLRFQICWCFNAALEIAVELLVLIISGEFPHPWTVQIDDTKSSCGYPHHDVATFLTLQSVAAIKGRHAVGAHRRVVSKCRVQNS